MVTTTDPFNLQRFIDAQKDTFDTAMQELREGKKRTHWIWFIFPQMRALGYSYNSKYYGISGIEEAKEYLRNESSGIFSRGCI